jgi:CDP-diacylglycerol--glycerol-3-phosphate 3-phosphatidyltransferase
MTIPHREPQKPSFREASKDALLLILHPLVRWLSIMRIRPDTLTVIGWTLALFSAVLFGLGYARIAGAVMLLGGLFDALDGAVARESNRMSSFGAFLDSTLDRLSESAVFVGLIFFYASTAHPYGALLAGIAMTFSLLTSYARARAEGLNIDCEVDRRPADGRPRPTRGGSPRNHSPAHPPRPPCDPRIRRPANPATRPATTPVRQRTRSPASPAA